MKKLLLVMALLLVVGFCFAQDEEAPAKPKTEFFNLELSIGVPVHWTTSPAPHNFFLPAPALDMDRTVTTSTSVGFSMNMNFGRRIGFVVDFDVFVGTDVMGHTPTDSYSNSLFGMNVLAGPVFYLYNGSFLRIPLVLGLHLYYWSANHWDFFNAAADDSWMKINDFQLGPGLYLGIQFHFNRSLYMFSRTNVAVDLYRNHKVLAVENGATVLDKKHVALEWGWEVKPTIGVGVKF